MEERKEISKFAEEFRELKLVAPKVGVVHNPFCLKHTAEDDFDMENYEHPERP